MVFYLSHASSYASVLSSAHDYCRYETRGEYVRKYGDRGRKVGGKCREMIGQN
jgi:hypothetical protein